MATDLDIGLMNAADGEFYTTDGGFVGFNYKGTDYPYIVLRRALPIKEPTRYISVADHENKEITIIRDLADLSDAQRALVTRELDNRYYTPTVREVLSVKDKLGYVYLELRLQNNDGTTGVKNCAVKDVNRNIRMLSETSLIIFDVDGNRYTVPELNKLDKTSLKKLDSYLF